MSSILQFAIAAPLIIQLVMGALLLLITLFICIFLTRSLHSWFILARLSARLKNVRGDKQQSLEETFSPNKMFLHLWREYKDTLHQQKEYDSEGTLKVIALRSTVPASLIFTNDTIVDTPVAAEFFRHLPGIFTGVGIIGTFWGLIQGLQGFRISDDPIVVRASLEELMHHVSAAFIVSATAIFLAMVATFVEKSLVTILYKKVEEITTRLDGFFHSGASEEYLARLTRASEETSSQSQQLKDALVTDLRQILEEMTERQIGAVRDGHAALGRELGDRIGKPLEALGVDVKRTSQGNSEAVTELVKDVLAAFSERLEGLFGGQITGINELQQRTIEALARAVEKLDGMADRIGEAGTKASDAIGERLVAAMGDMEKQQISMNDRITGFIEQLQQLVADSRTNADQHLQKILAELGEAVRAQLASLQDHGAKAAEGHERRERELATVTNDALAKLSTVVESLLGKVGEIAEQVHNSTNAMRNVTLDAVTKMSGGAETLYLAAAEFTSAGDKVSGTLREATALSSELRQAAGSVATASATLREVMVDHAAARDGLEAVVADLRAVVENTKKEASLTGDILSRIEGSAQKLAEARASVDSYLDGLTKILTETHETYAEALNTTLTSVNQKVVDNLSTAIGLLHGTIEELESAIAPIAPRPN